RPADQEVQQSPLKFQVPSHKFQGIGANLKSQAGQQRGGLPLSCPACHLVLESCLELVGWSLEFPPDREPVAAEPCPLRGSCCSRGTFSRGSCHAGANPCVPLVSR